MARKSYVSIFYCEEEDEMYFYDYSNTIVVSFQELEKKMLKASKLRNKLGYSEKKAGKKG